MHIRNNKEITTRLNQAMKARKIKQVDLVRLTGIPSSNINRYCLGVYLPKMGNLMKICSVLHISPDWLIDGVGEMDELSPELLDARKELMDISSALSLEQCQKALNFIKEYIL